ncbi:hypothetical protein BBJ29_000703 [Phytophthora kernoviae]|uniref:Uncharacterized protein n=1 Tax=Phytophthora kernoviae TaxID=325452 RepID=A0A3F2S2K2_9STRA|nr:hypothetical protein BBP00_00000589 [Phytophthora kernoviae]RLN71507.1 hypothetical protein BBJ29_000703 [Phytophthora kernoviae]
MNALSGRSRNSTPKSHRVSSKGTEVSGLSEYEQKRRNKMTENAAFLQNLGILHTQSELKQELQVTSVSKTEKKKQEKKKSSKPKKREPLRRSSRVPKKRRDRTRLDSLWKQQQLSAVATT